MKVEKAKRQTPEEETVKEKRSGSGAEQWAIWKYFSIMTLSDPHVREREVTSLNMSEVQGRWRHLYLI